MLRPLPESGIRKWHRPDERRVGGSSDGRCALKVLKVLSFEPKIGEPRINGSVISSDEMSNRLIRG